MSVGRLGDDAERTEDDIGRFADELAGDEEVRLSWTASEVHWANQWGPSLDAPTTFAATDRRVLFETTEGTTSIGYNRIRAVKVDSSGAGPDLSVAFLVCGGLCLLVGLLAATRDFANGSALVLLSVALLVAGNAMGNSAGGATVTIVVGNERQRLSFSADESIGSELAGLAEEC